jgi:competence protein ComEA
MRTLRYHDFNLARGALLAALAGVAFAAPLARLNVNTASVQQLEALPGVGPKVAVQIYRARPFQNVTEFERKLSRVPHTLLLRLEHLICFQGGKP